MWLCFLRYSSLLRKARNSAHNSYPQSISLRLSLPMATHPLTANYSLVTAQACNLVIISANVFEPLTSQFQLPYALLRD